VAAKSVAVVDYGMGNIDSVCRAIRECRHVPVVTNRPEDFRAAAAIILPGVGAFGDGMANLRRNALDQSLTEEVAAGCPTLGICLGMQLLADVGTENGETPGLGWIPGRVARLRPIEAGERIPHVGWNEVLQQGDCPLYAGIPSGKDFYFVHSYHFVVENPKHAVGATPYCGGFVSVVQRDNVFGAQFHPEKSQEAGMRFLANFLDL